MLRGLHKYNLKGLINGFVIPHSGRIKKIICESITFLDKDKLFENLINGIKKEYNKNLRISPIDELKTHFGKEDFKDDLLKEIFKKINFTYENKEEKESLFKIVKFKKRTEEERNEKSLIDRLITGRDPLPVLEKIYLIQKFTWEEVQLDRYDYIITVMKTLSNKTIPVNEGETINIEITTSFSAFLNEDLRESFISNMSTIDDILNITMIRLFGELNFNFTFLIELDPL